MGEMKKNMWKSAKMRQKIEFFNEGKIPKNRKKCMSFVKNGGEILIFR